MTGQLYLRIKRKKTTIFLECSSGDSIADLKRKLSKITKIDANDIRLQVDGTPLDETKTVEQSKLNNDDLVALTYKNNGEWEAPEITPLSEPQAPEIAPVEEATASTAAAEKD